MACLNDNISSCREHVVSVKSPINEFKVIGKQSTDDMLKWVLSGSTLSPYGQEWSKAKLYKKKRRKERNFILHSMTPQYFNSFIGFGNMLLLCAVWPWTSYSYSEP